MIDTYSDCVNYIGSRSDVPDVLSISSVFVLPSYYREGIPRILLEAATVGLPIITTDMPGCREVVKHNRNGWLVNPRSTKSLVEAIEKAIKLKSAQLSLIGERSKHYVSSKFSLDQVSDSYASIYSQFLKN